MTVLFKFYIYSSFEFLLPVQPQMFFFFGLCGRIFLVFDTEQPAEETNDEVPFFGLTSVASEVDNEAAVSFCTLVLSVETTKVVSVASVSVVSESADGIGIT